MNSRPPLPDTFFSFWSTLPFNFNIPTIKDFRIKYKELDPSYVHLEVLKKMENEKCIYLFLMFSFNLFF